MVAECTENGTGVYQHIPGIDYQRPLAADPGNFLEKLVLAHDTNRLNKALRKQVMSSALLSSGQELMFTAFICLGIYAAMEIFAAPPR